MRGMCGGLSPEVKPADETVTELLRIVKQSFTTANKLTSGKFEAVHYKTQVVAGTNYFIKVDLGEGKYAHIRVFKPLPHLKMLPALDAVQYDKTLEDPIDYFD